MKKPVKLFVLFVIFVFHSSCGQNQTAPPKENVTSEVKDSITTNVWDIKQDRNGNIWFAASDGVYRYDGKSFTNITGKLIPVPIFSILEDSKGNFWFGTYGSGAYYYDGKSFQHFTTRDGLAHNSVMPIYEDKDGIIWLGTAGGVSRYDGKSFRNFKMSKSESPPDSVHVSIYQQRLPENSGLHNDVHAIVQDKTGKMWFGTRGHTFIFDGKTFTALTNRDGKAFRNVWCIIKDKNDNIWFGADGLWRYDPSAELRTGSSAFTQIDQMGAGVISKDKKGNILTSIGGPIFRYDEQSLSDKKPNVTVINTGYEGRRNLPFGMLGADDGSIWIGSYRYNFDGKTLTRSK